MKAWRRKSNLKQFYGLTPNDYDEMLKKQNNLCFLCHNPPRDSRALNVDHCHKTGRVRGLLCDICNRHVISNKDAEFFERCLNYMKEPRVDEG